VLARAAGFPSRVAVGYLLRGQKQGTFDVTTRDAHAWPEVYLAGYGWTPFEPTDTTRLSSEQKDNTPPAPPQHLPPPPQLRPPPPAPPPGPGGPAGAAPGPPRVPPARGGGHQEPGPPRPAPPGHPEPAPPPPPQTRCNRSRQGVGRLVRGGRPAHRTRPDSAG